jgi:hypothetical protein
MKILKWLFGGALMSFSLFALSLHFGKVELNINLGGVPLKPFAPVTPVPAPSQPQASPPSSTWTPPPQPPPPAGSAPRIAGTWKGTYLCNQGTTGLTLTLTGRPEALTGVFHFYPVDRNAQVQTGKFTMTGSFDTSSKVLMLRGGQWIEQPGNVYVVDIHASVDLAAGTIAGSIIGKFPGCSWVRLARSA